MALLIFISGSLGQDVIENPDKPLNINAGRIVTLEKVLTISDESDSYYFTYPSNLKVAPDGTIFVYDWRSNQLLRFGSEGKFLHNFFKKGQGPGELSSMGDYCFYDNNVVIYDPILQKILWLDFKGEAVKEFKLLKKARAAMFQFYSPDTYYFIQYNFQFSNKNPSYVDIPYHLVSFTGDEAKYDEIKQFLLKSYIIPSKGGGGGGSFSIDRMITLSTSNRYLFISDNQEYRIKVFDSESNEIIRSFRRQYKRIKPTSEYIESRKKSSVTINGKRYTEPNRQFQNDIKNIFINKNKLWVMTSTEDGQKGILFDVFSFEGKYEDNFYVKFTDSNYPKNGGVGRAFISDGHFYLIETTSEETYVINKYKIIDSN